MVHRSVCEDCGEKIDWVTRTSEFGNNCPFCQFGTLQPVGVVGSVMGVGSDIRPEAQELVEQWREDSENVPREFAGGLEKAADDLEKLIWDRATAQEGRSDG